jgi:hypothetical protein
MENINEMYGYRIVPMPGAPNQYEVQDIKSGKGIIGFTERLMCQEWIETEGRRLNEMFCK